VLGSGRFGASGNAIMPDNNLAIPGVEPLCSYWSSSNGRWYPGDNCTSLRFVIEGQFFQPQLLSPAAVPGGLRFTVVGTLGRPFDLEDSFDLQVWRTYIGVDGGSGDLTFTVPTDYPKRFFRVRLR